jgi:hypothetical protein
MTYLNILWSLHPNWIQIYFIMFYNEFFFEWHVDQSILEVFVHYFYYFTSLQILYLTYHKHNGMHNNVIMIFFQNVNIFSYIYVKICLIFKLVFNSTTFWALFTIINLSTLICYEFFLFQILWSITSSSMIYKLSFFKLFWKVIHVVFIYCL